MERHPHDQFRVVPRSAKCTQFGTFQFPPSVSLSDTPAHDWTIFSLCCSEIHRCDQVMFVVCADTVASVLSELEDDKHIVDMACRFTIEKQKPCVMIFDGGGRDMEKCSVLMRGKMVGYEGVRVQPAPLSCMVGGGDDDEDWVRVSPHK